MSSAWVFEEWGTPPSTCKKWGMDFAQHLLCICSPSPGLDAKMEEGLSLENFNSSRDACFKNKNILFCRAALEVVIKVKSGPAEADGEVPMDFGLIQIPPLGFDCCPAAAKA